MLTREQAFEIVDLWVDDSLNILPASRMPDPNTKVRLVVFNSGFSIMVVAVWSYLGVRLSDEDATDLATDVLREIGWPADSASRVEQVL